MRFGAQQAEIAAFLIGCVGETTEPTDEGGVFAALLERLSRLHDVVDGQVGVSGKCVLDGLHHGAGGGMPTGCPAVQVRQPVGRLLG